jgi:hypothetical protein
MRIEIFSRASVGFRKQRLCLGIYTVEIILLLGAKVLQKLSVNVEIITLALEIAVLAEFSHFLYK